MFKIKGVDGCCGAALIWNLKVCDCVDCQRDPSQEGVIKRIQPLLDFLDHGQYTEEDKKSPYTAPHNTACFVNGAVRSAAIAITVPGFEIAEQKFKELGGSVVGTFMNKNTGNTCKVWLIPLNDEANIQHIPKE